MGWYTTTQSKDVLQLLQVCWYAVGRLKAMRRGLIEGGYESTAVKSGAINQLEGLLSKLLFVLQTRGLGYRCILTRHSSKPRKSATAASKVFCGSYFTLAQSR